MPKRLFGATDNEMEQLAGLFRLLSDRTRLTILSTLSRGERNVTSLCDELKLPQPTVSHHLGLLRMHNVIGNRRNGKQVFYALNGRVGTHADGVLQIRGERFEIAISSKSSPAADKQRPAI